MADPLSVRCPCFSCNGPKGFSCTTRRWDDECRPVYVPRNKPHVARVRAAEAQEKKEGDRG